MNELDDLIEMGWKQGFSDDELLDYFKDLYLRFPKNSRLSYEYGGAHDYLGKEEEAIPLYKEALELGISGSFRIKTLIQLGSSYRNLGRLEESMEVLEKAVEESEGDPAAVIFLSLTLWSSGKAGEATLLALRHIYRENGGLVQRYRRSLGNYLKELEDKERDSSI